MIHTEDTAQWNKIYQLGAVTAISAVLLALAEMAITFLPGGSETQVTVIDWFTLLQKNWFLGLRNLGLLNIVINSLGLVTFFALYAAHRRSADRPIAALAAIIAFIGTGVFYATNRAFPLLALSNQYAAATTDAQRAVLEAAGQALLAVGASHTPGTFLAFSLVEVAGVIISIVMLRNGVFSRAAGVAGILGFGLFLIFEFSSSFFSGLTSAMLILAMIGGLASMAWYLLIARRFWQLARPTVAIQRVAPAGLRQE